MDKLKEKIKFLKKLIDISLLESNWDSYGAEPVKSKVIKKSKKLGLKLINNDIDLFMSPGPNGEISIEFKIDNDYEFIIYETKTIYLIYDINNNVLEQNFLTKDILKNIINKKN
jgi:hypothetical protein